MKKNLIFSSTCLNNVINNAFLFSFGRVDKNISKARLFCIFIEVNFILWPYALFCKNRKSLNKSFCFLINIICHQLSPINLHRIYDLFNSFCYTAYKFLQIIFLNFWKLLKNIQFIKKCFYIIDYSISLDIRTSCFTR